MARRANKKNAKPIESHTGVRYPGTGGKIRPPKLRDVTEEMDDQPARELDVQQAGGEEPW
jgi:hypothetical protein